jgi:predicted transcriptional regulator
VQSDRAIPRPNLLTLFGERVQTLHKAAGITQADLAAAFGQRQPNIANVERGVINATLTTVGSFAVGLGEGWAI